MFDLLKKKISGFAEKILGNAEKKTVAEEKDAIQMVAGTKVEESVPEKPKENILPVQETGNEIQELNQIFQQPEKIEPEKKLPDVVQKEEREIKTKIGLTQKISGLFTGTITLKQETIDQFLEEFELSLLEADVEINTATALVEELRKRLSNKIISSRENPTKIILHEIKAALHQLMLVRDVDVDHEMELHKPGIILILGPNGAGKTTSIAKLTHRFIKQGKKVVLASADTFRAGSIEQLQVHATKLGVRLIKHQYGADPAAVAFDSVNAAKAEDADIVIIDTAGRQDTNKNLLEELKKIQRVIQPHLKIYVGESFTGQAILAQAQTFDEAIGIDGFILTKLDTDTKGGGVISIIHNLQKPILFFGTGQTYEDLVSFSLDEFLDRLIPEELN